MSGKARVDRLLPGLSARERAVLCVRAVLADEPEDPQIRLTMPSDQVARFNELLALGNGVLHILIPHALVLEGQAREMVARMCWFGSLAAWGDDRLALAVGLVTTLAIHRDELPIPVVKAMEEAQQHLTTSPAPASISTLLPAIEGRSKAGSARQAEGMSAVLCELIDSLSETIPCLRSRLITLERVVDEIAQEFGDEAAIPADLRELLETTRRLVTNVGLATSYVGELPAGEFDEPYAAQIRQGLEAQRKWCGGA